MKIGVPKEIKIHEYRVGLVPAGVRELVDSGHQVLVQSGAGAGIGAVFNASIQAKTRQPELRAEVERDQWLGFALTEACFFYGLVGGFIAFFL